MRTGVLRLQAKRRPSEVLGRHGFHLSGRSLSDLGCDFAGLVRHWPHGNTASSTGTGLGVLCPL